MKPHTHLARTAAALVVLASGVAQSSEPPEHGAEPKPRTIESQPAKKAPAPAADKDKFDLPAPLPPRLAIAPKSAAKDPAAAQRADEALTQLKEGNERWVSGNTTSPNSTSQRRAETAESGQHPFATILTCADSRIPAERVFDRGVGDLFILRVAGNIVAPAEAGTIEYGVEHLKVPLLVVMGHTKCGAVAAAAAGAKEGGKIATLLNAIKPAVDRASRNNPRATPEDLARTSVKENVWQSVFDLLKNSETCREKVAAGQLRIVGAVYDIASGKVEWLGEHPWQSELVDALEARSAAVPVTGEGH